MNRADGRDYDQIRPVTITPGYQDFAEGSVLIEQGKTKLVCSVSIEDRVPSFLKGSGTGWVTAEYAMLPRATVTRNQRGPSGRSQEIQRLIGRSLRAVTDLSALGERSLIVDCDVLQADGGTRTAAISGAYVALYQALSNLSRMGILPSVSLDSAVAATSVGLLRNQLLLDLCYDEDAAAEADFNVVMTDKAYFIEVQGTAEGKPFSRKTIDLVLNLAEKGIRQLFEIQRATIDSFKQSR
jgi:ribonuclease PH